MINFRALKKENDILPFEPTHPGNILRDELNARGLSQKEVAAELGIKPSQLNEIINEKRSVNADIALLLENILGIGAKFWLDFQSKYDLDRAKLKDKDIEKQNSLSIWNSIKEEIPPKELKQKEHLPDKLEDRVKKIYQIYEVDNLNELKHSLKESDSGYYGKTKKWVYR